MLLGDKIESLLSSVGIRAERVSRWLGYPCGCEERKRKLNSLDAWVRTYLRKPLTQDSKKHLLNILEEVEVIDHE